MDHYKIKAIDAHTHVFETIAGYCGRGELRSIGGGRARFSNGDEITLLKNGKNAFLYTDLLKLMKTYSVEKAILLQGSYLGFCNDYTHESQEKSGDCLYGMGTFDPYCKDYEKIMKRLVEELNFKGLKFEISEGFGLSGYHPDLKLDSERFMTIWEYINKKKLVISLDLGTFGESSIQVSQLEMIAKKFKDIRFVVEHIFFPKCNHYEEVQACLNSLRNCENVYFTTASIPMSVYPEPYPYPSACKYVDMALKTVGSDKVLWGSDVPTVLIGADYGQLKNYLFEGLKLKDRDISKIYYENAKRVYQI